MGDGHGGIDKVASSWTLHGWSPPWTRATVTLHGLKSPSTWMYDSTTYRNHAKNLHVYIAFSVGLIAHLGLTETLRRETGSLQSHLGETEIPIGETEKTRVSGSGYVN